MSKRTATGSGNAVSRAGILLLISILLLFTSSVALAENMSIIGKYQIGNWTVTLTDSFMEWTGNDGTDVRVPIDDDWARQLNDIAYDLPQSPQDALERAALSRDNLSTLFDGWTLRYYESMNGRTFAMTAYSHIEDGRLTIKRVWVPWRRNGADGPRSLFSLRSRDQRCLCQKQRGYLRMP